MTIYDFDRYVSPTIFSRGESYFNQGRVDLVEQDGNTYYFDVVGSDVYYVDIELDGDGKVVFHSCDCPYDGDVCKHVVACLLFLRDLLRDATPGTPVLDSLSAEELSYLYYLAYTGADAMSSVGKKGLILPADEQEWKATSEKCRMMAKSLEKKHFLIETRGLFWSDPSTLTVDWKKCLSVLIHMYANHPSWVHTLRRNSSRPLEPIILAYAAEYVAYAQTGRRDEIVPLSIASVGEDLSNPLMNSLMEAFNLDETGNLPDMLPIWVVKQVLDHEISLVDDKGDFEALRGVHRCLSSIREPDKSLIDDYCVCRMYWYYYTGELMPALAECESHECTHFLNAAIMLFQSDPDGALTEFKAGMEIQESYGPGLGEIPLEPINTFLYICSLGIRLNSDDAVTLGRLYGGGSKKVAKNYSSYEMLAGSILGRTMLKSKYDIPFWQNVNPWEKALHGLISLYVFGQEKSDSEEIGDCLGCALLQGEFAALTGREKITSDSWHYDALLPRVHRFEKWKAELTDLIDLMAPVSSANDNGERLIYYVKPLSSRVEVRTQGKLKNGGYSKGKNISEAKFRRGDCPMDEEDMNLLNAWSSTRNYGLPPLSFILPFCVGREKLFSENRHSQCIHVEVIEEKPYLSTIRKDGKLSFVSNILLKNLEDCYKDGLVYHWSDDLKTIKFSRLDEKVARVLKTLLALGSVPLEAEPMLESLFAPLQGRLEVQSDVKGGVQLERKAGSTVLCARLKRENDYYLVTFLAHPLDGGTVYLRPGAGNEVVIDSDKQGRYEVVRDLKKEKKALKKAMEILDCLYSEDSLVMPATLLAVLENVSSFKDLFYLEWPQGQELRLVETNTADFHITATGNGGWFELEGDLKVSDDVVLSMAQLMEMSRTQGRYIRLGENEYMRLSDDIRRQLGRLSSVTQKSRGRFIVPDMAMTVIADSVDDIVEVADEDALLERRKLIREASRLDIPIPGELNAILRPYQEDGFRWMMRLSHWHAGACLADDMGLGKTVQTIAFLLAHATEGPQLVVAPASVIGNWEAEIHRFAPLLKVLVVNDLAVEDRNSAVSGASAGVVVVCTYGVLVSQAKAFAGVEWISTILDEAHTIKNKETKMSAAVMSLKSGNRVILTGTPIQNHLGELWNLFRFINPGLLGSFEHFQETYVAGDSMESRDTLKRLVAPFMLRRTKKEVVKELPEKTEITLPVTLNEGEMAIYEVIRREARAELEQSCGLNVNALAMMTKLRMASCSASLVEPSWTGVSSKLDIFVQKLLNIVDGGNNVLVFSQFTSFLELAKQRAVDVGIKDYLYLDGSTPVSKRRKMVEEFQKGKFPVFFISLKAGGLGLNLTGANYVIHLDPWWNPAIEQQATDRAYRIGQQQNVTVYHLISAGTIEEKILRLHSTKQQLADAILSGSSASHKMTAEQILELLG